VVRHGPDFGRQKHPEINPQNAPKSVDFAPQIRVLPWASFRSKISYLFAAIRRWGPKSQTAI
jgi:hypothetical protein